MCSVHVSTFTSLCQDIICWLDLIGIVLSLSSSTTPVEAKSTFFNYTTFETGQFFSFLWYISLSGLKQSLVLIYALYIQRVNYSLTAVVSKIPFYKWQSIWLTKETEVINKENHFSWNPNIWTAKLWMEISNLKFYDKQNMLLWQYRRYICYISPGRKIIYRGNLSVWHVDWQRKTTERVFFHAWELKWRVTPITINENKTKVSKYKFW